MSVFDLVTSIYDEFKVSICNSSYIIRDYKSINDFLNDDTKLSQIFLDRTVQDFFIRDGVLSIRV